MKCKKAFIITAVLIIAVGLLTGCFNKKTSYLDQSKTLVVPDTFYSEEDGIEFELPEVWKENYEYLNSISVQKGELQGFKVSGGAQFLYLPKEAMDEYVKELKVAESPGDRNLAVNKVLTESRRLCLIIGFDKNSIQNQDIADFTGFKINEKIADKNGYNYYLCYDDQLEHLGLSNTSKRAYEALYKGIPEIKDTIKVFEPTKNAKGQEKDDKSVESAKGK